MPTFSTMNIGIQKNISRKQFLANIPLLAVLPGMTKYERKNPSLNLSFSTLGCPDWSFDKIIDFAKSNNYTGLEVRGILRQMDLTKVPEFSIR